MRVPELDVNTRCELFSSPDQHAIRVVPRPTQHTTRVECKDQKQHAPCVDVVTPGYFLCYVTSDLHGCSIVFLIRLPSLLEAKRL